MTPGRFSLGKELFRSQISLVFPSFQFFRVMPNVVPVVSHLVAIAHHPFMEATEPERAAAIDADRFAVIKPGNGSN